MSRCPCRHSDGRQCLLDAGHDGQHLILPIEPEKLYQASMTIRKRLSHLSAREVDGRLNAEVLGIMQRESEGMDFDGKMQYATDWYQTVLLASLAPDECAGEA